MINIILNGSQGKMGKEILKQALDMDDVNIIGQIDRETEDSFSSILELADVDRNSILIIDFSHREGTIKALEFALNNKVALLIGTTGLMAEDINKIEEAKNEIPITLTSNTSQGINLMRELLKVVGKEMNPDWHIEIFEKHHSQKKDAPSGTAITMEEDLEVSIGDGRKITSHSYRGGTIPGEHTVVIAGIDETIEITHRAFSRSIFAIGALMEGKRLMEGKK